MGFVKSVVCKDVVCTDYVYILDGQNDHTSSVGPYMMSLNCV